MSEKVKVRIAVAVDDSGTWNACGWGGPTRTVSDEDKMGLAIEPVGTGERRYWLEAELDLPTVETALATVQEVSP